MRPPPWARMEGVTARTQFQIPLTFTAITRSHSASGMSSKRCGLRLAKMAALLTRTSMRPKRPRAASTSFCTDPMSLGVRTDAERAVRGAELLGGGHRIGDVGDNDPG